MLAADYWRNTQNEDGSWGYVPGDVGTGSMTCAGIGGLAVSSAALESGDAAVENGRVTCCRPHDVDDKLDRAIDWLATRFSVTHNPRPAGGGQPCLYYYLYGVERAGRLTARRFIGDHDWYREGAEFLVREQDSLSHYWKGNWYAEREPRISTAMALLFLSKGRRPIVMAKVKYGEGDTWNQHRRDAAHLTEYTEDAWDLGLTWQVMDPATGQRRRPASSAGALHQRQPGAAHCCRTRKSCEISSIAAASSLPKPAVATPAASTWPSTN